MLSIKNMFSSEGKNEGNCLKKNSNILEENQLANLTFIFQEIGQEYLVEVSLNTIMGQVMDNFAMSFPLTFTGNVIINERTKNLLYRSDIIDQKEVRDGDVLIVRKSVIEFTVTIPLNGEEFDIKSQFHITKEDLILSLIETEALKPQDKVKIFIKSNEREFLADEFLIHTGLLDNDSLIIIPAVGYENLYGIISTITDVPSEVIKMGPAYLEEYMQKMVGLSIFDRPQPLNECKLIFVGSGAVGKTSLINRIIEDKFNPSEEKTDGIEITKWSFRSNKKNIKLNVWDFGGQEIMHATHKFFMTRRAIYALVINPRAQDQHAGDLELNYWLKLISSFAGSSPIIVVINKCEIHKMDLSREALKANFPQIVGFVETSCKMNFGIKELNTMIEESIKSLKHLGDIIPLSYIKIKEELENINKDYLYYNEYLALCKKIDKKFTKNHQKILINLLNDLGVMLHIPENRRLADTQVLNPEWITNGVYKIINSTKLIENKGIINEREIADILPPTLYPSDKERGFIMDMMSHFELCYQLHGQNFSYFVPGAFPKDKPSDIKWEHDNYVHFIFKYDVLPNSIISRFLVKLHSLIHNNHYWRQGAILQDDDNSSYIEAFPFERKIVIKVSGKSRKRHFLTFLRKEFELIHKSLSKLSVEPFISLNEQGTILVSYDDLISYEEEGIAKYFEPKSKKFYSTKELLEGVEERDSTTDLKTKISNGRLWEALKDLKYMYLNNNEILMLLARFNKIKNERSAGNLDDANFRKEENNITMATLRFIDEQVKE